MSNITKKVITKPVRKVVVNKRLTKVNRSVDVNKQVVVRPIIKSSNQKVVVNKKNVKVLNRSDRVVRVTRSPQGVQGPPGSDLEEVHSSVSLGPTILVRSETDTGKEVYFATQTISYPQFAVSISGAPSSSSVYATQSGFTVTGGVSSGSLTAFTDISTNKETGTIVDNSATFTNTEYQAVGFYTATVTATGESLDPIPVSSSEIASTGWERFVPAYWVVGEEPTALPSSNTGVRYGSNTVSGSVGANIYLVTVNSGFRFNVGPYEIFENLVSTIIEQEDTAGTSRDFKVYRMGKIGTSGSATFTLV